MEGNEKILSHNSGIRIILHSWEWTGTGIPAHPCLLCSHSLVNQRRKCFEEKKEREKSWMVAGVISSPANARTSLTAPRHADAAAGPLALLKLKNVKRREKLKKKRISKLCGF